MIADKIYGRFMIGFILGMILVLGLVLAYPLGEGEAKGGNLPLGQYLVYKWLDSDSWVRAEAPYALVQLDDKSPRFAASNSRWHRLPKDADIRGEPCESRPDALCFMKVYQEKGGRVYEFLP